jgi:streptogramin lyase
MGAGFSGKPSIVGAGDKNIWFADPGSAQVGYINPWNRTSFVYPVPTPIPSGAPGAGTIPAPADVQSGPSNTVEFTWAMGYGTASTTQAPQALVTASNPFGNQIGQPLFPSYPFAVASDGSVWFGSQNQTSSTTSVFPALAHASGQAMPAMFVLPGTMQAYSATFGPDGNVWVGTTVNQVLQFDTSGGLQGIFTISGASKTPQTIIGPDNNMWVAVSRPQHPLEEINVSTGALKVIAPKVALPSPNPGVNSMVVGPDKQLWYAAGGKVLHRVTIGGAHSTYRFSTTDTNGGVTAVARGSDNNIWFVGGYNGFGVFHMQTITAVPAGITVSPGSTASLTVSEKNYTGTFTATNPNCFVSPTTGTTFTVSPPSTATASTCIETFVDANHMATVYVPINIL